MVEGKINTLKGNLSYPSVIRVRVTSDMRRKLEVIALREGRDLGTQVRVIFTKIIAMYEKKYGELNKETPEP